MNPGSPEGQAVPATLVSITTGYIDSRVMNHHYDLQISGDITKACRYQNRTRQLSIEKRQSKQ